MVGSASCMLSDTLSLHGHELPFTQSLRFAKRSQAAAASSVSMSTNLYHSLDVVWASGHAGDFISSSRFMNIALSSIGVANLAVLGSQRNS